jgi:hypothetical protein
MILTVLDSAAVSQKIISNGQESIVDKSGSLAAGSAQVIANANTLRSGFFLQNLGVDPMWLNDLTTATAGSGSIRLAAGEKISAPKDIPLNTHALSLIGTSGSAFTLREW